MEETVKISDREKACLEVLAEIYGNESDCMYIKGIAQEAKTDYVHARRSVRALARKGLAEYVRGLMNEDGQVAGSGYRATLAGAMLVNACVDCQDFLAEYEDGRCQDCWDKNYKQSKELKICKTN